MSALRRTTAQEGEGEVSTERDQKIESAVRGVKSREDYYQLTDEKLMWAAASEGFSRGRNEAMQSLHWRCDCSPDHGPAHCHACMQTQEKIIPWAKCPSVEEVRSLDYTENMRLILETAAGRLEGSSDPTDTYVVKRIRETMERARKEGMR